MLKYRSILAAGVAVLALAACGADEVASAGGDGIVINNPGNGGGDNGGGNNGGDVVTPATSCPSGTFDAGTIGLPDDGGSVRNCRLGATGAANPIITENLTLPNQAGTVYSLNGRVDIGVDVGGSGNQPGGDSATLSIDPGVVVIGENRDSFLVVNRGSQIDAVGTASDPIIFTSRSNVTGTVTESADAEWGSVTLLGRAPTSNCDLVVPGGSVNCEAAIEGVGGANAPKFGGATLNDNSGRMQYVQIRFSGRSTQPNSELQGLTTGGVGRGTQISHIQIHNSGDDGIESFGGAQNMSHLVFTGVVDDSLDVDTGYNGAVQWVLAARRPGGPVTGDPTVFEIDSSGNVDVLPRTYLRVANFTAITNEPFQAITLRGGADVAFLNGIVKNSNASGFCLRVNDEARNVSVAAGNEALQERGPAVFSSVVFDCANNFAAASDPNGYGASIFGGGTNVDGDFETSLIVATSGLAFRNGANETAHTPVANIAQYEADAFVAPLAAGTLVQTDYIGAAPNDPADPNFEWWKDWTCDSAVIDFGNDADCTDLSFD